MRFLNIINQKENKEIYIKVSSIVALEKIIRYDKEQTIIYTISGAQFLSDDPCEEIANKLKEEREYIL